jgi:hypothetical protein
MRSKSLVSLAYAFYQAAISWVKTATAVCKKCGRTNEYLDPNDPDLVCGRCKRHERMRRHDRERLIEWAKKPNKSFFEELMPPIPLVEPETDKKKLSSFIDRFEKLATKHRMISQDVALRLLAQHGIDITDPAELEDFYDTFGDFDTYPHNAILKWLKTQGKSKTQEVVLPDEEESWRGPETQGGYYGSAEGLHISKKRALQELKNHGHEDPKSIAQFLADMGDKETYDAQEVLIWLGY